MANLSNLTAQQLAKLTQRPNWLSANSAISGSIAGRVFPSNEGWMLSPTKIHPEGKRMPAECVMAIPNLNEYLETVGAPDELNQGLLFIKSMSVTRRSRSRYIVNIALDESVRNKTVGAGTIGFNFQPKLVIDGQSQTGAGTNFMAAPNGNQQSLSISDFHIASGETSGRLQMDLNFDEPVESIIWKDVNLGSWLTISVAGASTTNDLVDADKGTVLSFDNTLTSRFMPADSDRWDGANFTVVP